jgi:hypothetical protein
LPHEAQSTTAPLTASYGHSSHEVSLKMTLAKGDYGDSLPNIRLAACWDMVVPGIPHRLTRPGTENNFRWDNDG